MELPKDQTEFLPGNEVFPDNFVRREVQSFVVHCTFMDDGCEWQGEVRHLEDHTNQSCEFLKIPCVYPDCGMLVKKADLAEHLEDKCKFRLESCGFCKRQINFNNMKVHHEKECPAYPVVCVKCNKDGIPRAKLLEHQDPVVGDCDAVQVCPFLHIGCSKTEVLSHKQKKEHLEKENSYHGTLLLQHGIRMGQKMESLLTRDPRIIFRNPHLLTNYSSIVTDMLSQIQISTVENRDAISTQVSTGSAVSISDDKVACSYCGQVPRLAVQTICGHLYCERCLVDAKRQKPPACTAVCGTSLDGQWFPDKFMRREIEDKKTSCCSNVDRGSHWRGRFDEALTRFSDGFNSHLRRPAAPPSERSAAETHMQQQDLDALINTLAEVVGRLEQVCATKAARLQNMPAIKSVLERLEAIISALVQLVGAFRRPQHSTHGK